MKLLKFILHKIIIIEVILIILYFAKNMLNVTVPMIDYYIELIINTGLAFLTPIALVALIAYIILSLLSFKIVEIILAIVLGGIILYYFLNH